MDYNALAQLLFPQVTETPETLEQRYPPRDVPAGAVVTRMAPSPTGFVHLGNLVQGLVSERMAHQSGGVLFLRVEDTDAKREVPGAVEVLIDTLKHYGILFDEGATIEGDSGAYGPYRQRQRAEIYHVYAKELVEKGKTPRDWRKSLYYHYYEFPGFHSVRAHYGVKMERYKLMHFYVDDNWELYDLKTDPEEMHNLYGKKGMEKITTELKAELARLQKEYDVPQELCR
mgnify:CR=1 FL=1